jgi:hypothetical protein
VGGTTVATLLADRIAPGLLDRYLARTGYSGQQTEAPADPDRPGNLWQPADGRSGPDYGAHGRFDRRSHPRSPQQWASHHRGLLGSVAAATGLAALRRAVRGRHG